jgi:hypothetical protein
VGRAGTIPYQCTFLYIIVGQATNTQKDEKEREREREREGKRKYYYSSK